MLGFRFNPVSSKCSMDSEEENSIPHGVVVKASYVVHE